jgi:chromosome segregation ATPase
MKKTITFLILIGFFTFFNIQKVTAQSHNYPYFMQNFWPKNYDNESKVAITNRLIENTPKGRDYVSKLNNLYREFDQLMKNKNSMSRENEKYYERNKQYVRQYDMANATLQLAKANYNACRQNCGHLLQNVNNIINNMNNLRSKIDHSNNIIKSTYNRVEEMSKRLYALDGEQAQLRSELQRYIKENIKNGTISLVK